MRVDRSDDALETLFQPFADGLLAWPGDVLFLRARDGLGLRQAPRPGLLCEQDFRPAADALERGGLDVVDLESLDPARRFPLVLVLPPRQREEARALFAQAVARCAPGGPTGMTMTPPVLSCWRRGGGTWSMPQVTMILSNGPASSQP